MIQQSTAKSILNTYLGIVYPGIMHISRKIKGILYQNKNYIFNSVCII